MLVLCQSSQSLVISGVALFLPLIRSDLHLSFAQAGSLDAVSTLVYALMQIPSGALADRIGPRQLFLAGLLGVNLLALGFSLQRSFLLLVANQALTGLFRSLVFAPGLLLITALFPADRRATAMGLFVAGGFSSNILLNVLGPVLVAPLGWRGLFASFAGVGLVMLVVFWRRTPIDAGPPRIEASLRESLGVLRSRAMWLVAAIQYIRLGVALGMAAWLPTFLVAQRGYSLKTAGLIVALGAALTAPSNFLGGYLSDRSRRPLAVIGGSLAVLAVATSLVPIVHGLALLVIVVSIESVFVQLYFGPLFVVPLAFLDERDVGLASGFGNFFANLGGFTFIYVLGAIRDTTGSFAAGFALLGALCVAGVACTAVLARLSAARAREAAVTTGPATGVR